jgi:hypothetical protein
MQRRVEIEVRSEPDDNAQEALHLVTGAEQLVELPVHAVDEGPSTQCGKRRIAIVDAHVPVPPGSRETGAS